MAELTVRTEFSAHQGTSIVHERDFELALVIEGEVFGDFVDGVDDLVLQESLQNVANSLNGKWLDDVCGRSTLENIAKYAIANLSDLSSFSLRVTSGSSEVKLHSDEVDLEVWPAELALRRGISLLLRGKKREALADFSLAIEIAPGWPAAYIARGRCFRHLGEKRNAMEDFQSALILDTEFGEAYRNRANMLLESGLIVDALADFDRAVELLPSSALAFNNRGYALQVKGAYNLACDDHRKAISLDASYAEAFRDLADSLEYLGLTEDARGARAEAARLELQLDPVQIERAKLVFFPCQRSALRGQKVIQD